MGSLSTGSKAIEIRLDNGYPLAGVHQSLHNDARLIGGCKLRFGENDEGRRWYAEAALRSRAFLADFVGRFDELESGVDGSGGSQARNGLFAAILAGDGRLVDALIDDVNTLVNQAPNRERLDLAGNDYDDRARTIAALVEGDLDRAARYQETYGQNLNTDYDEALHSTHRGLITDDSEQVRHGIETIVRIHEDSVDGMRPWNQPISTSGTVHILTARHRGIDCWVDSDYVPTALQGYELDDRIDLPHPDYIDPELIPD